MKYNKASNAISTWAEEDKPREKLLHYGKASATNADLLSIIIGSGNSEYNAKQIAQNILAEFPMEKLSKISINEFKQFKGIGLAKATNILAAIELGKRISRQTPKPNKIIDSSYEAYNLIRHKLEDLPNEEFWIILLNRANRVISIERMSIGGISSTVVDPRLVIAKALQKYASNIILVHNHPSGNLKASQQDVAITMKLIKAAKFFDMNIYDHLIITPNSYYSFSDEKNCF